MTNRYKYGFTFRLACLTLICPWLVTSAQAEYQRPYHPGYGHAPIVRPYGYPRYRPPPPDAAPQSPAQTSSAPQRDAETVDPLNEKTAIVTIGNMRFDPPLVKIKPGGTVTWQPLGEMPHAVIANDGSLSSPLLVGDVEFSHTFEETGSYPYHCVIHPSMQGEIRVME